MSIIPIRTSYASLLDHETLRTILGAFQGLHPDLLPIVVYKVLDESYFGELNEERVRQALRDAFDLAERGVQRGELQSVSSFVAAKVRLSLENQALLARIAPEDTQLASAPVTPQPLPGTTQPFRVLA